MKRYRLSSRLVLRLHVLAGCNTDMHNPSTRLLKPRIIIIAKEEHPADLPYAITEKSKPNTLMKKMVSIVLGRPYWLSVSNSKRPTY